MSFNISSINNSNSGNLNPSTTFTGVVPTEQPPVDATVIETPHETKKGKAKDGWVFSYAEQITLSIDDDTTKELSTSYGPKIISEWAGKKWHRIPKNMSMDVVMRINSKAGKEIIKISSKFVERFPVDKDSRDRLDELGDLTKISKDLGFGRTYLNQVGTETCRTITKERADKVNNYIKEKNIGNGSEIFDLEGNIRLAKEETTPADTIVTDTHSETKKRAGKGGRAISYADETKLHINDETKKTLATYELRTLSDWTGKKWTRIPKIISVRDAMRINSKAGKEIIKISSKFVEKFPVDKDSRNRLDQLEDLVRISEDLGFGGSYLVQLGTEKCRTVTKERAEKINKYIKEKNIGNGSEIFDLEHIIQLATHEQIPEEKTTKKLSENIWVKLEDEDHEQLRKLPIEIRKMTCFTVTFDSFLKNPTILLKNAVIIEKLSKKTIFNLSKESIVKISVFPEKLDEIKSLLKEVDKVNKQIDKKIRNKIQSLDNRLTKTISAELAETINACFEKTIFDLEALLDQGIKEAEEEAELLVPAQKSQHSTRKSKRPLSSSDSSTISEDEVSFESSPKRRRVTNDNIQTVRGQFPPSDEYMEGANAWVAARASRRQGAAYQQTELSSDDFMAAEYLVSFSQQTEPGHPGRSGVTSSSSPFVHE